MRPFVLLVGCLLLGACHSAPEPVPPVNGWSQVGVAAEQSRIYWLVVEDPALAAPPYAADWFTGHPRRDQLIQATLNSYAQRSGQ